jgi:hypothetical protein
VSDQLFRETGRYRIPKQIRGRWYNYLDPKINKDQWTAKQDLELISQVKLSGKKWALISKNIPGRNENMVKNRLVVFFFFYKKIFFSLNIYYYQLKDTILY